LPKQQNRGTIPSTEGRINPSTYGYYNSCWAI